MKKAVLLVLSFCCCTLLQAQRPDSLTCGYPHRFSFQQAVAPSALIATGATLMAVPSLHNAIDVPLRDWTQRDGHSRLEVEDFIQYTPGGAVLLLKACGLQSRHGWRDMMNLGAGSCLIGATFGFGLKYALGIERPYGGVYTSFPSGHTLTAFLGAELLRREYGEEYPVVAIAGYTVATGVGMMRIYNNRHWASDVLAGAGFGILSASLMYWLSPYLRF